jgi:hypothetical protein
VAAATWRRLALDLAVEARQADAEAAYARFSGELHRRESSRVEARQADEAEARRDVKHRRL